MLIDRQVRRRTYRAAGPLVTDRPARISAFGRHRYVLGDAYLALGTNEASVMAHDLYLRSSVAHAHLPETREGRHAGSPLGHHPRDPTH